MIYTGHSRQHEIIATGLVNTSTGELEKIDLNPGAFAKNVDVLLWRRIR
jgi:hypothetical protein